MSPPDQPFSERQGYVGQPKEITIREDAPKDLRSAFLRVTRAVAREYRGTRPELQIQNQVVAPTLDKWVDPEIWLHYTDAWKDVERLVYECEWFRVYDLMETVNSYFDETAPASAQFSDQLNDIFAQQGVAWQLVEGKIVARGDEVFERTVNTAVAVLKEDRKPTAAGHLRFAITALSARPKANTCGAVAHATSAVECVLGEITGQAMTLGTYLDKHASLFHPALKKGLHGVYGYASDEGARHGKEGTEPTAEEAEFTLAVCAAACTLLTRKHQRKSLPSLP